MARKPKRQRFTLRAVEVKNHLVVPNEEDRNEMQARFGLPFRVYTPAARAALADICASNKITIETTSWSKDILPMLIDAIKEMEPSVEIKSGRFLFRSDNHEHLVALDHRLRAGLRKYSFHTRVEYQSRRNKHAVMLHPKFDPTMDSQDPGERTAESEACLKIGDTLLFAQVVDRTAVMPRSVHWRASSSLDDNEVSLLWNTSQRLTPDVKERMRTFAFELLNMVGTAPLDTK